jgi:hypothetical protein
MSSLNQSLNRLRGLAPELNKTSDEAARLVLQVETLLTKELAIGVVAEVAVHSRQLSAKKVEFTSLAHTRLDGKFRIAVVVERRTEFVNDRNFPDYAWETVSETPWAECPRDVKLETFPKLPDLLKSIIENAEKAQTKVLETQLTLTAVLGQPKDRRIEREVELRKLLGSNEGQKQLRNIYEKMKGEPLPTAVYLNPLIPEILDHELSWRDAVLAALHRISARHPSQVIRRQQLLAEELEQIVADTGSQGQTPDQTVSWTLQRLRDEGLLEFLNPGEYRLV